MSDTTSWRCKNNTGNGSNNYAGNSPDSNSSQTGYATNSSDLQKCLKTTCSPNNRTRKMNMGKIMHGDHH